MTVDRERLPKTDLTLDDARSKLAGWHFSQEALTTGEREILYVAEAVLRALDAEIDELAQAKKTADRCRAESVVVHEANVRFEARLAKVPALVEALRECEEALVVMPVVENSAFYALVKAQEALAVWDAEQPGPDRTP